MARELVVTVRVENRAALRSLRQLDGVMVSGARTAARSTSAFRGMASGIGMISGGLLGAQGAVAAFRFAANAAIGMNASLERSTLQFQTLMGDAELAERHVRSLFEFAKRTPFETGPIIEASKFLQQFGGDALNSMDTLTRLGDAAAATGAPLESMAMWVGRLHAELQAGRKFGEAAQRLTELAVITPDVRNEMEKLQAAGGSAAEVFAVFEAQLDTFNGAMEIQAETWAGLTSTFTEGLQLMIADAADASGGFGFLKDALKSVNDAMAEHAADGLEKVAIRLPRLVEEQERYRLELEEQIRLTGTAKESTLDALETLQAQIDLAQTAAETIELQNEAEAARLEGLRQIEQEQQAVIAAETAAREEAEKVAEQNRKLAEEQEKLNQQFRDSVQQVTVLTTAFQGWNDANTQYLGLAPSVTQNVENLRTQLQGLTSEGLLPATGGFIDLDGALNGSVNPTVHNSIGIMDSFKISLKDIWTQGRETAGGLLESFTGLFSGSGGLTSLFTGGMAAITSIFSGGMTGLMSVALEGVMALGGVIGGFFSRLFGGPSEAELAGREAFHAYRDAAIEGLNEGQIREAAAAGWANPDDAALFISIRDSFREIGIEEAIAQQKWEELVAAMKEGPEAVQQVIDEIEEMKAQSEAQAAAQAAVTTEIDAQADATAAVNTETETLQSTQQDTAATADHLWTEMESGSEATSASISGLVSLFAQLTDQVGSVTQQINAMSRAAQNASAVRAPTVSGPIPALQHGGIVTKPTVALIGEEGPEAVIPLNRTGGAGGLTVNLDLRGSVVSSSRAIRELSDQVGHTLLRQLQSQRRLTPAV